MIDGAWIREALNDGPSDSAGAVDLVEEYVSLQIQRTANATPTA